MKRSILIVLFALLVIFPPSKASAFLGGNLLGFGTCLGCGCVPLEHLATRTLETNLHIEVRRHIRMEFEDQGTYNEADNLGADNWMLDEIYWDYLYPIFMKMANEATTVAMQMPMMFGSFLDAKQQMETQATFQELAARAHKDYHPSTGVCTFGTNVRSLASTAQVVDVSALTLDQWMMNRQTANVDVSAAEGAHIDLKNRLDQLRDIHCDIYDNNNGFSVLCPGGAVSADTVNKDIDYARTMNRALTLGVDFTDNATSPDETDIMALASNLYGHRVFFRIPETAFHVEEHKKFALDLRSVIAKRSVASASFNTIVGLKSYGSPLKSNNVTTPYMYILLEQLGLSQDEIEDQYGIQPSYYAQMDILTKRIFQHPSFYTDLYDKPANIDRKKIVLQSIGLMQDFDLLQSHLRTEMMLSVLLELEVVKLQRAVENQIGRLRSEGERI